MPLVLPAQPHAASRRPTPTGAKERRRAKGRTLGHIEVHDVAASATEAWALLEQTCPGSAYQTRRWLEAWTGTIGRACGAKLMLVVAHGKDRRPAAFLPFGVIGHQRLRIAGFLGGRDSNANLGLFRPEVAYSKDDLLSMFRAATLKSRWRPDVFILANQPESWEGMANPLLVLPHQASPSFCHTTRLSADFAAYYAGKLSPDSRKKLAKKRRKLEQQFGPVRHVQAADASQARALLAAFFEQKLTRLRLLGIDSDFEHACTRDFFERASLEGLAGGAPVVELHALIAGDRLIATYGGAHHRRRFHAMFNSFDVAEDVARCSPGDLLLTSMLESMSGRGVEIFDLGIGEARYKEAWCERAEPLFDTIIPVSARGRAFAVAEATRLQVKRHVKQNPWLWSLAQKLRAGLG